MINFKFTEGLRTWIEVDKKVLKHNYQSFKKLIGDKTLLMAVAKSNAYGHGILDYPKYMEFLGVNWIGVDSAVEGFRLRQIGVNIPILVLGYTLPANYKKSAKENISLTISHKEHLLEILKLDKSN